MGRRGEGEGRQKERKTSRREDRNDGPREKKGIKTKDEGEVVYKEEKRRRCLTNKLASVITCVELAIDGPRS